MNNSKMTKYIGHVASGTMLSRILGYVRDMLVGWIFGAGMAADAFYAAFRIPNLLRRLMGEGALSSSFVPVFSEYLTRKDREESHKLYDVTFTALLIVLTFISLLGIIFAPQITRLIAYGFSSNPEKMELTILLTRLLFPFLLFICLAALQLSVLNSLKLFFIPAVAPAFLSISEIVFMLGIAPLMIKEHQIIGLALAVGLGGVMQFLVQVAPVRKSGFKFKFNFNFNHPGLKQIFFMMIPAMWGISVDQINAFVDTICASFLREGSVTALYYSNRVMQLPLALFGIAVASVSLPLMSTSVSKNDPNEMKKILAYSVKISSLAIIPAMAGLIVLGKPIIKLLFEHGKFNANATMLTNSALLFYSFGLPAYAITKILVSSFYSMKETKTPVKIATLCMLTNVVLNVSLMGPMGVGGLALATSISSWLNSSLLFFFLRKRIGRVGGRAIFECILKIIAATSVMSLCCYFTAYHLFNNLILSVFGSIIIGIVVYVLMTKLLKIDEMNSILSVLKKEEPTLDE